MKKGVLFIGLKETLNIHEFHIDNQTSDELALHIENNLTLNKETSCLIFYDALMEKTEVFLEALYSTLDRELTIAGGGAGHLDFQQKPCIYSNSGLKSNCVQLVALPYSLSTGIGHGWEILAGPFLVTESQGSNIASLNYQDAFTVYKQTVEILSNYKFEKHEFFEISKHFPFGIENINGDLLVRDPIVLNKSSIQCVGNVPSSSMVYILKGQKPALIKSVDKALKTAHTENSATTIVFDCISRKLYLEEDFKQELEMLFAYKVGDLLFGVLSLGEIANDRGGAMKLYNKSTVIGCL